jgi:predicted nucleic acid-binding protein
MPKVFVDTAAWIALTDAADELHASAKQVMASLRQQKVRLVTTEFVLLEVANALSAPSLNKQGLPNCCEEVIYEQPDRQDSHHDQRPTARAAPSTLDSTADRPTACRAAHIRANT